MMRLLGNIPLSIRSPLPSDCPSPRVDLSVLSGVVRLFGRRAKGQHVVGAGGDGERRIDACLDIVRSDRQLPPRNTVRNHAVP
jgi:hypothetical protein